MHLRSAEEETDPEQGQAGTRGRFALRGPPSSQDCAALR